MTSSKKEKREETIWQRRFWEHQIRNEHDYQTHFDYIHYNPVKHGLTEKVVDWPYSTFHRYVSDGVYDREWGGYPTEGGQYGEFDGIE